MNTALKNAILGLLVVGQLALVGCATPQVRATHAPTTTLTVPSVQPALAHPTGLGLAAPGGGLQPVYMGLNFSDGEIVLICLIGPLALLTYPLWGPFYLLFKRLRRR